MNKWSELFLGLIVLIGVIVLSWFSSVYNWTIFGKDLDFLHASWMLFKGGLFWIIVMIGLLLIVLGISDLKD